MEKPYLPKLDFLMSACCHDDNYGDFEVNSQDTCIITFRNTSIRKVADEKGMLADAEIRNSSSQNYDAQENAVNFIEALNQGRMIEGRVSKDNIKLSEKILAHKEGPVPLLIGSNVTYRIDGTGDVHVTFHTSLDAQEFEKRIGAAFDNAISTRIALTDGIAAMAEDEDWAGRLAKQEAINTLKKAKYNKVRGRDILRSQDASLLPSVMKESGLFTPCNIDNIDGNLSACKVGESKKIPVDASTFRPVHEAKLKPGEYEWVIEGKEIMAQMADNGINFSGSSSYRTKQR